jgi:aerobic carbon-monoxide dehydrogenase medium subunit
VGLLAEALPLCARPAIRTRGTIGGSLAHADPAAEIPAVALALDATLTALGPGGERTIPAASFFTGAYATALATDEILTAVTFPDLPERSGTCFLELSRRHADRATVGVAVAVTLDDGTAVAVRIALANVAATPVRAVRAELALTGRPADRDAVAGAAALATEGIDPPSDLHASSSYRRHVTGVLVQRALTTAIERARGTA